MKDLLVEMAAYNKAVNARLLQLLAGLDETTLKEDQGAYFKSILGTLEHLTISEVSMLRRFGGFFSYECLSEHHLIQDDLAKVKTSIQDKPQVVYTVLAEADAIMVEFIAELKEADLPKRVSFVNMKGDTIERPYWSMIAHILNHQTHHRGEISVLLDRKGITNDLSGFNNYTK